MTRREALLFLTEELNKTGMVDAAREARFLLCAVLSCDPLDMHVAGETLLTQAEERKVKEWLARRVVGEPLSRIKGSREFWSLSFLLNEATLDPRADSETLVEAVLRHLHHVNKPLSILDVGTGSGCLLLALLSEYKNASGVGVDINPRALEAARDNARINHFSSRATFKQAHWCEGIEGLFDLIVSNPPYIRTGDISSLDRNVKEYDPHLALDGGHDGLDAYRALIPQAYARLNMGGIIALEIGAGQEKDVNDILSGAGFQSPAHHRDLGGHIRVLTAEK